MKCITRLLASGLFIAISTAPLQALVSRSDTAVRRQFELASCVFEGRVISAESFINEAHQLRTRFSIHVVHPYKGNMPNIVDLILHGGVMGGEADAMGCQPQLRLGEERLFFLGATPDGSFHPLAGPASVVRVDTPPGSAIEGEVRFLSVTTLEPPAGVADLSQGARLSASAGNGIESLSSSATNLLTYIGDGLAARFLPPDQGDPIPYLVDADSLPNTISLSQALGAVSNALAAWEAVSSVRFQYEGLQSLGQAANSTSLPSDGKLRIQLHDSYGAIGSSATLGIGGRSHSIDTTSSGWTTGGQVFGNDFHRTTRGYVVLNHTQPRMQTLSTFEEVLCHEVGHALSMDHSTPDTMAPEGSPAFEAMMYYIAHEDGRGAAPTRWDTNVLNQVHPRADTPPYSFNRVIDVVVATPQPSLPGVNEIELRGYDLQTAPVVAGLTDSTSGSGTFSESGGVLRYTPAVTGTGPRLDPSGNSFYDATYARFSDGLHASPYVWIRVISFSTDTVPAISDGLPDEWMSTHFGSPNGALAAGDPDHDGLTNFDEHECGMDPNLASSAQRVTVREDGMVAWQGKAYELYELHWSTNLTDWSFFKAVLPTSDQPSVRAGTAADERRYYSVFKVN